MPLAEPSPQPLILEAALDGVGSFAPGPEARAAAAWSEPLQPPLEDATEDGASDGATGTPGTQGTAPIRVLLAEDHLMVRAGIRALLESLEGIEVVAEASGGHETLMLLDEQQREGTLAQVAILDISMGGMNGMQTAAHIARRFPTTRVIMLSMHDSEEYVLQSLRVGATGYLLKDSGFDELETAVRTVAMGQPYLSPAVSRHVVTYLRRSQGDGHSPIGPAAIHPISAPATSGTSEKPQMDSSRSDTARVELVELTPRQREILPLLAQGHSTGQIAKRLLISIKTVETHRAQLMGRLNIFDIAGLTRYAIRHGYIESP